MKLNRFEVVTGRYIEEIPGQSRIGYAMSDTTDFYDMIEWSKKGGYQGSIISFYDYNNGKVYEPFQKQRNVLYGTPVYLKKSFWWQILCAGFCTRIVCILYWLWRIAVL